MRWRQLNLEGVAALHTGATLLVGLRKPTDRAGATYFGAGHAAARCEGRDWAGRPEVRAVHRVA